MLMENSLLCLNNASVGYKDGKSGIAVVSGITASLRGGELVALIGRNGAVKSTLLRTLAAYQKPLSGTFEIDGVDIGALSLQELSRKISVVLTGMASVANMSVRELVALGRTPYTNFWGTLSSEDNDIVDHAMEQMEVTAFAERNIATLSDGERQKCLVAKAIAQQTPIVLLDEPTAYLDFQSKVRLMQLLKRLAEVEKKAVVVSTHDLEVALRLADRLWLVSGGTLVEGTPGELADCGALQAFIDDECVSYNTKENRIEIKHV